MKIAISSTGRNLESEIDPRFGRCAYFLIVEVENKKIKKTKVIKNTAKAQAGGAGISAGEIIANQEVDAVITTNLGPRAFDVFSQFGIKVYSGKGKIKEVLEKVIKGNLKELSNPTGPQHTGLK